MPMPNHRIVFPSPTALASGHDGRPLVIRNLIGHTPAATVRPECFRRVFWQRSEGKAYPGLFVSIDILIHHRYLSTNLSRPLIMRI